MIYEYVLIFFLTTSNDNKSYGIYGILCFHGSMKKPWSYFSMKLLCGIIKCDLHENKNHLFFKGDQTMRKITYRIELFVGNVPYRMEYIYEFNWK